MARKLSQIPELASLAGGNRTKFETLVGKEITVHGVSWDEGDYGNFAIVSFTAKGEKEKHETSTGAEQVLRILKEAEKKDLFPFTATVKSFASKKFKGKSAYSLE